MDHKKWLAVVFFMVCLTAQGGESTAKNIQQNCPVLTKLMADTAFIGAVASTNGLSSMRFLSLEFPTQREMAYTYAQKHNLCDKNQDTESVKLTQ